MLRLSATEPDRLDRTLAHHLGVGRRQVQRLLAAALVRVDGRVARDGGRHLEPGAVVTIALDGHDGERTPLSPAAQPELPLEVLYVDDALVAVQKPAGLPTHPLRLGEPGTVASALVARFPECSGASPDPREAGWVHRLDVGTSGLLLAARSRQVWHALRASFGDHEVAKEYLAVTRPAATWAPSGKVTRSIVTPRRGGGAVRLLTEGEVPPAGATPLVATTQYELVERRDALALVRARCHTGRLHQVRAHLAASGAPLVDDPLYGASTTSPEPTVGFFLHATQLTLPHPKLRTPLRLRAPLPPAQEERLKRWGFTKGG
jgi:23S rRNA pseudouridine1911/1915/1917 synthase